MLSGKLVYKNLKFLLLIWDNLEVRVVQFPPQRVVAGLIMHSVFSTFLHECHFSTLLLYLPNELLTRESMLQGMLLGHPT